MREGESLPELASLPPWLQVVLSILVFIITAAVYIRGLFKKAPDFDGKDVAVPSLAFADSVALRGLVEALRQGNKAQEEAREINRRIEQHLAMINERTKDILHLMIRHTDD